MKLISKLLNLAMRGYNFVVNYIAKQLVEASIVHSTPDQVVKDIDGTLSVTMLILAWFWPAAITQIFVVAMVIAIYAAVIDWVCRSAMWIVARTTGISLINPIEIFTDGRPSSV